MERRTFLIHTCKCALGLAAAHLLPRLVLGVNYNWRDIYRLNRTQGKALVLMRIGQVLVGGSLLEVNNQLEQSAELKLGFTGRLILLMPDGSLLFLRGKAQAKLEIGHLTGTLIELRQGALQLITNSRKSQFYPFLIQTNLNQLGTETGVVYIEMPLGEPWDENEVAAELAQFPLPDDNFPLKAQDVTTDASMAGSDASQANLGGMTPDKNDFSLFPQYYPLEEEYICLCHGGLNLMNDQWTRTLRVLEAKLHFSNYVEGADRFKPITPTNHSNEMIRTLMTFFQGGYFDNTWLPAPIHSNKNIWLG